MEFAYFIYTFLLIGCIWGSIKISNNSKKPGIGSVRYKISFFSFICVYSIIIGCRYNVGVDYLGYLDWYKEFASTGTFPVENELGYIFLNQILIFFDAHYAFLFIAIAFLQVFFLLKSFEKAHFLLPWYFFFFFTSLLMFSSMNIMRQTIAYFVFFYTLILWLDKKYLAVVFFFLIGLSFHKSILLFAWVYPFLRLEWFKNRTVQISILFFVTFVATKIIPILIDSVSPIINLLGYQYYLENIDQMIEITKETSRGEGFGKYLIFIIDALIVYYSLALKDKYKQFHFSSFYNLYFLGAVFERLFADNFILARTNDYLINFRVLMLSYLCVYLFYRSSVRKDFLVLVVILILMLSYFYKGIENAAARCSPFEFFFNT